MKTIKYIIYKEGKYYISQSLNVDVSSFGATVEEATKNLQGKTFLFDSSGKDFILLDNFELSTFNLFIGPEGGWTEEEITKAKSLNFQIASLGPLTLRGETAAIIATYLISNLC